MSPLAALSVLHWEHCGWEGQGMVLLGCDVLSQNTPALTQCDSTVRNEY